MQKIISFLVLVAFWILVIAVPVRATAISSVRNQQNQTQQDLNEVNSEISTIQSQRDRINVEITTMNDELVEILTSIGILEEEIDLKQKEINIVKGNLVKAQRKETLQYEAMKKRIKFMYEQGNMVYMQALLGAVNYSDMMNKAEYVEGIYNYDRKLLTEYVDTRSSIEEMKITLEDERAQMKEAEYELQGEKSTLEKLLTVKKITMADYDAQIESAQKKADAYKLQLQQQTERIRKMEEQERKRRKAAAKKKKQQQMQDQGQDTDGDGSTSIDVTTGETEGEDSGSDDEDYDDTYYDDEDYEDDYNYSAGDPDTPVDYNAPLGQQICDYACQFVGNPYVYGGTSLTNGADCSGFTQSVYAHFGISIPRDSYSQRSCGVAVAYENAQPGDLICYAGHVAIYLGDGQIVHASTERTGITYGYASYRTILAVRRVI